MSYLKKTFYLLGLLVLATLPLSSQAAVWPDNGGVDISTKLESGYEPSGVVWHERLDSLFTIWDNGYLTQMSIDGEAIYNTKYVGGDLEGITIVDDQSNYIYLLTECPQKILEFNLSTWTLTGKSWTLNGMAVDCSSRPTSGAESMTYNSAKDLFYVGSQYNGDFYIYDIDLSSSASVNYSEILDTGISRDSSGLFYSEETELIYAIFDSSDLIQEYDNNHELVAQHHLYGSNQEGITLLPGCPNDSTAIVIAQDSGEIMKYSGYPISCSIVEPVTGSIAIIETGSSGIPYIQDVVEGDYLLSMEDLKNGVPEGTEVVIFPGGADFLNYLSYTIFPLSVYLDTAVTQSLQEFVNAGGGFVGICGGSIIGSELLDTDIDYSGVNITEVGMASLAPVKSVGYMEWYEDYAGTVNDIGTLSFEDHVIAGDYASGTHLVDYYGGPYFKDYSNVEVLATYTKDFMTGQPAIVAKDNVVLSAVHPEYDSETQFLLENMIAWVKGDLVQPEPVDADSDGYIEENDCDDNNGAINPGATEVCDLVDNNCDGNIDEGVKNTYYLDADADTYGSTSTTESCTVPTGYTTNNNDCDDNNSDIHENQTYYLDNDQDGLGDSQNSTSICSLEIPNGYVDDDNDSNDNDYDNDGSEIGIDCNDADVTVWDLQRYYADTDQDGLGDPESYVEVCSLTIPEGYVTNYSDEAGEPAPEPDPEPEPVEELVVKVKGRYIHINGEKTKIFKHKPIKTRYRVSEDESKIVVIGLFKKRATIVTLELDSDYQITSQDKNIIRYSHVIKKLKLKLKYLKQLYF